MSTDLCTEAMKKAFESKYSRDWNDPAGDEIKAIWAASWVAAADARIPTRESVADDLGVLVFNGDLPANMEDLADWVQAGHFPVAKVPVATALVAERIPYAWEVRQGGRTFLVSAQEFTGKTYDMASFKPLFE